MKECFYFPPGGTNFALTPVHNVYNRKSRRCVADWPDATQNTNSCSSLHSENTHLLMIYPHVRNAKVINATRTLFSASAQLADMVIKPQETIRSSTENSNLAPVAMASERFLYRYFLASQMIINPSFVFQTGGFDFGLTCFISEYN